MQSMAGETSSNMHQYSYTYATETLGSCSFFLSEQRHPTTMQSIPLTIASFGSTQPDQQ
jgi:hypothetical protein